MKRKIKQPLISKEIKMQLISEAIFVVILFLLLQCVFLLSIIVSDSMEPTLVTGDITISSRLTYHYADVERGDIIVFYSAELDELVSKRVIGIAGDEIEFHDGYVYLNGEKIEEPYLDEDVETNCSKKFVVPADCVFVLGDNREGSNDSRYWAYPYISTHNIEGKTLIHVSIPKFVSELLMAF